MLIGNLRLNHIPESAASGAGVTYVGSIQLSDMSWATANRRKEMLTINPQSGDMQASTAGGENTGLISNPQLGNVPGTSARNSQGLKTGLAVISDFFNYSYGSVHDVLLFLSLVSYFQASEAIKLQARDMELRQELVRALNGIRAFVEGKADKNDVVIASPDEGRKLRAQLIDLGVIRGEAEFDEYFELYNDNWTVRDDGTLGSFKDKLRAHLDSATTGEQLAFNYLNQLQGKLANTTSFTNRLIERVYNLNQGVVDVRVG